MATLLHRDENQHHNPALVQEERYVADEFRSDTGVGRVARFCALGAGVIVSVIGLMAVLAVDWSHADWRTPIVDAAGMNFSPTVAVATGVLGLIMIAVAAGRGGESKLGLGAVVTAFGAAVLLIDGMNTRWDLTTSHGWLALGTGVVFLIAGMLSDGRRVERRVVSNYER